MIQNEGYIEFDIKALLFYVLRRWKPIIIFSVVLAVLLGAFMAYSEYDTSLTVDTENPYWAEYQQYQDQLALYEDRVSMTQEKIDILQDYLDNSVLMNTDHRNVFIAKATYYVDSGYQIMPENSYQNPDKTYTMAWYYSDHLKDYQTFEAVGAEVGIDAKYLMELVDVYIENNDILSISVSHSSQQAAEHIMEAMQAKLKEIHLHLESSVGKHDITNMMDTCGIYIDKTLKEAQQEAHDEMLELQDELLTRKQELYALKEGPTPDDLNVVKAFIKWFILGGVAGGVLIVGTLFLASILKNRVCSSAQLAANFQVDILGELIHGKALSPISRMLNRAEGALSENSEENFQYLAEKISHQIDGNHKILLCSDMDTAVISTLTESLNKYCSNHQFVSAGNLLKDVTALHAMKSCDAVLMIAVRDHSKNTVIRKTISLIRSYKKDLIGFIIAY